MHVSVIKLITLFQLLTLFLYYFGPINYPSTTQSLGVACWVLLYLLSLNLGYISAKSLYLKGRSWLGRSRKFLIIATFIVFIMTLFAILRVVPNVSLSMTLGQIYSISQSLKNQNGIILEYIRMFLTVYSFGIFPVLVFYWHKYSKSIKLIALLGVLANLLVSVLMGINKELFNTLILLITLLLIKRNFIIKITKQMLYTSIVLLLLAFFVANYFVNTQLTRHGSFAVTGQHSTLDYTSKYNKSHGRPLVLYSALSLYLTQGYYAFDMSFSLPFQSTYGAGNSTFISRQIDRFSDTNISDNTYPARLEEKNWDRYTYWSTFYLWWASDIHYIGVFFLMFLIGFLFRLMQNTMLHQKDDVSACICYSYLVLLLFYLSANNFVFQSGGSYIGFLMVFIPLIFGRKISLLKR